MLAAAKRMIVPVLGLMTMTVATDALSWGSTAHTMINKTAATCMQSPLGEFFRLNSASLGRLAVTPDNAWKHASSQEGPYHFFQWDNYQTSAIAEEMPVAYSTALSSLGASYIKTNGGAIWRVGQIYQRLVTALKAHNWMQSIQMAGVLGHYVGDLSMPMHLTADYDGQSIGQRGIHKRFEVDLVDAFNQAKLAQAVLAEARNHQSGQLESGGAMQAMAVTFAEAKESFAALPQILDDFSTNNMRDASAQIAPLMGLGAGTLADIYDQAAAEAGVTSGWPKNAINAGDPAWFALQDN